MPLLAGSARIKTTPPIGTRINGDFVTHYATYIHDDLFSKALVLKYEDTIVALVVVDICIMTGAFLDGVKSEITRIAGIPATHVLISSTHTHAAGSVADVHLGSVDPAYAKKLPGLIVESVRLALQNLKPAQIAFGAVLAPEHLLCRRYEMSEDYIPFNPVTGESDKIKTNPFGAEKFIKNSIAPTDPELSYLAVRGLDNSWIGLFANYSLHYVGDWENGTISADYFGVFSNALTEKLQAGSDFVAMMSNGTSGDVNIWDFLDNDRYPKAHFEKSHLIGSDLASKVLHSISGLEWQLDVTVDAVLEVTEIPVVKPSPEELLEAAKRVAIAKFETIGPDRDGLRQIYAREQILLNEMPAMAECPVQAIRIGAGMIGALPGEFFSETGLYLKSQVGIKSYFTVSMANGNVGYVPPEAEMEKGGYETWRCRYSCLVPEAEKTIREKLLALTHRFNVP